MFKPNPVNHAAFDTLTPESCYWAGMLMADGFLSQRIGPYKTYRTVCLSLEKSDHAHVCRFRDFMGSTNKVIVTKTHKTTYGNVQTSCVWISSERAVDRLIELGITYRKTKTAVAHADLAASPDFWRGFVDGDGTVTSVVNRGVTYPVIGVGGTLAMMEQFKAFVERSLPCVQVRIGSCRGLARVGFNGSVAKEVIRLLYKDATVSLDRKMKKAQEALSWAPRRPKRAKFTEVERAVPVG